jgi:hypothetical protein
MADYLLLESGDRLLLESGDGILLEQQTASVDYLLLEAGDALLLESGDKILLETSGGTVTGTAACTLGAATSAATGYKLASFNTLHGTAPSTHMLTIDQPVLLDCNATVQGMEIVSGGALVFEANASRLLRVDDHALCVAGGALSMKPASAAYTHEIRFVNIDETIYTPGGDTMDHHNSPGFCVDMSVSGTLVDLVGTAKTAWTRTTAGLSAAATSVTVADATGWQVGDEIVIMPTEASSVSDHWDHFDRRTITAISSNTVTVAALTYAHPTNTDPVSSATLYPEVGNLTRNVKISGDTELGTLGGIETVGRAHVMWMGDTAPPRPHDLRYFEILHMGPRQEKAAPDDIYSELVLGKYGLHFHKCADATDGFVIDGMSLHDIGSRAFVPHGSHGMTCRNSVIWSYFMHGLWWDTGTSGDDNETDNFLIEDCLVGRSRYHDPNPDGILNSGMLLGAGVNLTCRRNVVAGLDSQQTSAGFNWPESLNGHANNVWTFEDCDAHNNSQLGIYVWQNDNNDHDIVRARCWNNSLHGAVVGAYRNTYQWFECKFWGHPTYDLRYDAQSYASGQRPHMMVDSYAPVVGLLEFHALVPQGPAQIIDTVIGSLIINEPSVAGQFDFVDCGLTPGVNVTVTALHANSVIRIQEGSSAWQITSAGTTTISPFYP